MNDKQLKALCTKKGVSYLQRYNHPWPILDGITASPPTKETISKLEEMADYTKPEDLKINVTNAVDLSQFPIEERDAKLVEMMKK